MKKVRFGIPATLVFAILMLVAIDRGSLASDEMDSDGDAIPDSALIRSSSLTRTFDVKPGDDPGDVWPGTERSIRNAAW